MKIIIGFFCGIIASGLLLFGISTALPLQAQSENTTTDNLSLVHLLPDIEKIYEEALTFPLNKAKQEIYDEDIAEFYQMLLERTHGLQQERLRTLPHPRRLLRRRLTARRPGEKEQLHLQSLGASESAEEVLIPHPTTNDTSTAKKRLDEAGQIETSRHHELPLKRCGNRTLKGGYGKRVGAMRFHPNHPRKILGLREKYRKPTICLLEE